MTHVGRARGHRVKREIASCVYNSLTFSFCCFYADIFQFYRFPAFNRCLCSVKHSTQDSDREWHFIEDVDEGFAEGFGVYLVPI